MVAQAPVHLAQGGRPHHAALAAATDAGHAGQAQARHAAAADGHHAAAARPSSVSCNRAAKLSSLAKREYEGVVVAQQQASAQQVAHNVSKQAQSNGGKGHSKQAATAKGWMDPCRREEICVWAPCKGLSWPLCCIDSGTIGLLPRLF